MSCYKCVLMSGQLCHIFDCDGGEESISNIWIGRWEIYIFIILSHVFNCHSKLSSYLTYAEEREKNDG